MRTMSEALALVALVSTVSACDAALDGELDDELTQESDQAEAGDGSVWRQTDTPGDADLLDREAVVLDGSGTTNLNLPPEPGGGPTGPVPCVSTTGARACYKALGDEIWVLDTAADGHHAEGWLAVDSLPFVLACINTQGAGVWQMCSAATIVPEHDHADLQSANMEGNTVLDTS
ncbi:MAG TPA: hypothetical protein VKB80_17080, partial [Kofleriaceae bacterium]|nr:hypothetical protein [Kofleriaceae bacterium]